MNAVVLPWLAEIGLITWRDMRNAKHPPLPSELLSTFVIFGALSLIPEEYGTLSALAGWGLVVATLLNAYDPSSSFYGIAVNPSNTPGKPGFVPASSTTTNQPPAGPVLA